MMRSVSIGLIPRCLGNIGTRQMKKTAKRRIKCAVSDIIAIPLFGGRFAFARIYNRRTLGIYSLIADSQQVIPIFTDLAVAFHVKCVTTPIENGQWPIVGHLKFSNRSEAVPPPQYVQDIIDPTQFRIEYKGRMRKATSAEVKGIDVWAMYGREHLLARIDRELPTIIAANGKTKTGLSRF